MKMKFQIDILKYCSFFFLLFLPSSPAKSRFKNFKKSFGKSLKRKLHQISAHRPLLPHTGWLLTALGAVRRGSRLLWCSSPTVSCVGCHSLPLGLSRSLSLSDSLTVAGVGTVANKTLGKGSEVEKKAKLWRKASQKPNIVDYSCFASRAKCGHWISLNSTSDYKMLKVPKA